jgi:hypothetical protein
MLGGASEVGWGVFFGFGVGGWMALACLWLVGWALRWVCRRLCVLWSIFRFLVKWVTSGCIRFVRTSFLIFRWVVSSHFCSAFWAVVDVQCPVACMGCSVVVPVGSCSVGGGSGLNLVLFLCCLRHCCVYLCSLVRLWAVFSSGLVGTISGLSVVLRSFGRSVVAGHRC